MLHPWLKEELTAILEGCEPAPAAEQLDRFFPPVRMLLVLDNLAGHHSREFVQWCAEHGICLL